MHRFRGVSEIVSALLLLMIVSLVGFAIYMAFLSQSVSMTQTAERMVEEARAAALAGAYIVGGYVYVNLTSGCGEIHLYLTASARPLNVEGVYVGSTPVYPNVTAPLAGCTVDEEPSSLRLVPGYVNYTVIPLTKDVVSMLLAEQPRSVDVKIVTKYNSDVRSLRVVYVT